MLTVLSSGILAKIDYPNGLVHSVFKSAVNLSSPANKFPLFITLLTSSCANLPTGIRIQTSENHDWRLLLRPQQKFHVRGGLVRWEDKLELNFNLASGLTWAAEAIKLAPQPTIKQNLAVLDQQLEKRINSNLARNHRWQADYTMIEDYLAENSPTEKFAQTCTQLVGWGSGLTPAGDDFLVGYLALLDTLLLGEGFSHLAKHRQEIKTRISQNLQLTTDTSRHYLTLAIKGYLSQTVSELLVQLLSKNSTNLISKLEKLLTVGASSGMATAKGLTYGLAQAMTYVRRGS